MTSARARRSEVAARAGTQPVKMRVLCLGNELLADDSLGSIVAENIRQFAPPDVQVLSTPESGFDLIDYVLNTSCLVVIDTVTTGAAAPGTIYLLRDKDLSTAPGGSPHYVGLQEVLSVARNMNLRVAKTVIVLAVEAADCMTVGATMHLAVRAAIPAVVDEVRRIIAVGGDPIDDR